MNKELEMSEKILQLIQHHEDIYGDSAFIKLTLNNQEKELIKKSLTAPLPSDVEEAIKQLRNPHSAPLKYTLTQWEYFNEKIIRKALRLQPQRTQEELRDEIIERLNDEFNCKWEYKEYNYPIDEFRTDEILEGFYSGSSEIVTSKKDLHISSLSLSLDVAKLIIEYFDRFGGKE